jgi:hypothetical protein
LSLSVYCLILKRNSKGFISFAEVYQHCDNPNASVGPTSIGITADPPLAVIADGNSVLDFLHNAILGDGADVSGVHAASSSFMLDPEHGGSMYF